MGERNKQHGSWNPPWIQAGQAAREQCPGVRASRVWSGFSEDGSPLCWSSPNALLVAESREQLRVQARSGWHPQKGRSEENLVKEQFTGAKPILREPARDVQPLGLATARSCYRFTPTQDMKWVSHPETAMPTAGAAPQQLGSKERNTDAIASLGLGCGGAGQWGTRTLSTLTPPSGFLMDLPAG